MNLGQYNRELKVSLPELFTFAVVDNETTKLNIEIDFET